MSSKPAYCEKNITSVHILKLFHVLTNHTSGLQPEAPEAKLSQVQW